MEAQRWIKSNFCSYRAKVELNPHIVTLMYLTWKYAHTYVSYKNENYSFPILWVKASINITFMPEHFWRGSIMWRESILQHCFSYSCRCDKTNKSFNSRGISIGDQEKNGMSGVNAAWWELVGITVLEKWQKTQRGLWSPSAQDWFMFYIDSMFLSKIVRWLERHMIDLILTEFIAKCSAHHCTFITTLFWFWISKFN